MARVDITCAYSRAPCRPSRAYPGKTQIQIPLFQMAIGASGQSGVTFSGLVDSGAEYVMFTTAIADALDLDWKKAPTVPIQGIGGRVNGHAMDVTLAITEHKYSWPARVVFCPPPFQMKIPLLGYEGFFEHLEVRFQKGKSFRVFLK